MSVPVSCPPPCRHTVRPLQATCFPRLISIRSVEVLLPKVEAIQIEQDLWGRIFGYGTIIITGTGGTKEVFAMIENPYEFRSQVQKQLMLLDAQGGAPRRMRSDVDGPS